MSKRKINQQQQRRISTNRAKLLDSPELTGLVLAHYGTSVDIEDNDGNIVVCSKRQHLGTIVPGDNVIWQMDVAENTGVVVNILPRRTELVRPDARGNLHAVAANVDQMFIVIAPNPEPSLTTIDRYLVAAQLQNIAAILVLNKEDILAESPRQQELLALVEQYAAIGVTSLIVSAKQKHLQALQQEFPGKNSVFVGQSGVGKSSIIAAILPNQVLRTGELVAMGMHGKHTTTTARLYHMDGDQGNIIDSPGIREFPLWAMPAAELAQGFVEFIPYLHECKFRNCIHLKEPGCALLNAADAGKIAKARLLSYQKILSSMQA